MKRSKLCYGVLSVLAIIFGWSLNVSSDTSALKYNVNTIPLGLVVGYNSLVSHNLGGYRYNYVFNDPFSIGSHGLQLSDFSDSFLNNYTYALNYNSNLNNCQWSWGRRVYNPQYSGGGTDDLGRYDYYNFDFPYYADDLIYNDSNNMARQYLCNIDGAAKLDLDINSFPPYVFGNPDYRSLVPYRYGFNGLFVNDSYTFDGLNVKNKLNFVDIFSDNYFSGSKDITNLTIPLGRASNNFDSISSGDVIKFSGSFYLDTDNGETVDSFDFDDSSTLLLIARGFPNGFVNESPSNLGSSSCSVNYQSNSNPEEFPHIINFSCSWISNYDFSDSSLLGFSYRFIKGTDKQYIFKVDNLSFWVFDSSYVVTHNDETPANVNFSDFSINGNDIDNAPGFAGSGYGDPDYDSSLLDMFNFSFTNPFEPILHLFTNSNQCASIPTIAGMIHSNESTVCPWFPSTVRSIATPVLGLASMMLVFGFAVRWLGSSSGNLFEDSRHEEVSNQGGRWGHFKKGGR